VQPTTFVVLANGRESFGIVRKVLRFRKPGTEFVVTSAKRPRGRIVSCSAAGLDLKDVYTEAVLKVNWIQPGRAVEGRLGQPVLEAGVRGPAVKSAREVTQVFPCGRFVPVQHLCPAHNIYTTLIDNMNIVYIIVKT
jgi:hypothetical protein